MWGGTLVSRTQHLCHGFFFFQKQYRAHFQRAGAERLCSSALRACPQKGVQWVDTVSQAFTLHHAVYIKPTLHWKLKQSPLPLLSRKKPCSHTLFAGWSCCCVLDICQTWLLAVVAEGTWTQIHTSFDVQAGLQEKQEVSRHCRQIQIFLVNFQAALEHEFWGFILGWSSWHLSEFTALQLMGGWICWVHKSS